MDTYFLASKAALCLWSLLTPLFTCIWSEQGKAEATTPASKPSHDFPHHHAQGGGRMLALSYIEADLLRIPKWYDT